VIKNILLLYLFKSSVQSVRQVADEGGVGVCGMD